MTSRRRGWSDLFDPGRAEDHFSRLGGGPRPELPGETRWTGGRWDPVCAWWCSEISRAIYRRDGRPDVYAEAGLTELRAFESGPLQAALVQGKSVSFLAFRGTDEPGDWLVNLRARPVDRSTGGLVHGGFARGFDDLWPDIARSLQSTRQPVVATGHSLGGALATLFLSRAPLACGYTFGAPRVGDEDFNDSLQAPLFRAVHGRDPVPSVPPRRWGFAHGGELQELTSATAAEDTSDSRFEALVRRLSEVDLTAPPAALADHAPVRYSDALLERAR